LGKVVRREFAGASEIRDKAPGQDLFPGEGDGGPVLGGFFQGDAFLGAPGQG
jgi:hypothetical protein